MSQSTGFNVRTIEPRRQSNTGAIAPILHKKRVAAYARVSTDLEEQAGSYEAQVKFYTEFIQGKPEWDFVKVYSDEGISGTSIKHREGFQSMIRDAVAGKIDMIITKSISRFARNTVDTLTYVRKLREHNVEVWFEKENIYTMDTNGELLLSLLSAVAQSESEQISSNVKWGKRKRFADGHVSFPYKSMLGYRKGANGRPEIVPEEAKIVRLIYQLFMEGCTISNIADRLQRRKILSPEGKPKWHFSTLNSILTNDLYSGFALLQKTYIKDCITKQVVKNKGEIPLYLVEHSHDPIIDRGLFELVQTEIKRRKELGVNYQSNSIFSGHVFCGDCGRTYGRKVWHSNDKYRYCTWQCNQKYQKGKEYTCQTPSMKESVLEEAFVRAVNEKLGDKQSIISAYERTLNTITDCRELEKKLEKTLDQIRQLDSTMRQSLQRAQVQVINSEVYSKERSDYELKRSALRSQESQIEQQIELRKRKKQAIQAFVKQLRKRDALLESFDPAFFQLTTDRITVYSDARLVIRFRDGSETTFTLEKGRQSWKLKDDAK